MEMIEWLDWLGAVASVATVSALVIVIIQQIRQSRAVEADIRAFLHLSIQKEVFKDKRMMVNLSIFNSGDVTAEEIKIRSENSATWFALQGSLPPEFANESSKLKVRPREEIKFLLGPLDSLSEYKSAGFVVECQYLHLPRKRKATSEKTHLTLAPQRYILERKLH